MGVPLITLTQKPLRYDPEKFGGDDTQLKQSGVLAAIARWDANAQADTWKASFIFILKQAFVFLDKICLGRCFYGKGGFEGKIKEYTYAIKNHPTFCASFLERNRLARERIVVTLGGIEVCKKIPAVDLKPADFKEVLELDDQYFSAGQGVVQGEDPAGRTFVLLRVRDPVREGNTHIMTVFQKYRETESKEGDKWLISSTRYKYNDRGVEGIVDFIKFSTIVPK